MNTFGHAVTVRDAVEEYYSALCEGFDFQADDFNWDTGGEAAASATPTILKAGAVNEISDRLRKCSAADGIDREAEVIQRLEGQMPFTDAKKHVHMRCVIRPNETFKRVPNLKQMFGTDTAEFDGKDDSGPIKLLTFGSDGRKDFHKYPMDLVLAIKYIRKHPEEFGFDRTEVSMTSMYAGYADVNIGLFIVRKSLIDTMYLITFEPDGE